MTTLMVNDKNGTIHMKRDGYNMSLCGSINYENERAKRTRSTRRTGSVSDVTCNACKSKIREQGVTDDSTSDVSLILRSEVAALIGYASACPWEVTEDYMDGLCDKINRVCRLMQGDMKYRRCESGIRVVVDD